jgi:hypothetical protein
VRSTDPRLRRVALLSAGAWAVHQLRYALAPVHGGDGPGHAYLHAAVPLLTALVALAAAGFAVRLVAPRSEAPVRRLRAEWLSCTLLLIVAFLLQEGIESATSSHGPVLASGGWLALPLAVAVGLFVALMLRGARAAVEAAAPAARAARVTVAAAPVLRLVASRAVPRANAPLRHLAARPPPGPLVHHA